MPNIRDAFIVLQSPSNTFPFPKHPAVRCLTSLKVAIRKMDKTTIESHSEKMILPFFDRLCEYVNDLNDG